MDAFVRNVKDIAAADRQAIEHLLGAPLTDNQQVVIQVMPDRENLQSTSGRSNANGTAALPEWTHVYAAGLVPEEGGTVSENGENGRKR
jgi:hypothetical protein